MSEEKKYRLMPKEGRFRTFEIQAGETDVLVGVDAASWDPAMAFSLAAHLAAERNALQVYIKRYPFFSASYEPLSPEADAPDVVRRMSEAAAIAGVGPMAAVAGTIAGSACRFLMEHHRPVEVFIENGGDCALSVGEPLVLSVNAGYSRFGGSIGIELPPGDWGVASSAGRLGHSKSFGAADACTVVSDDASLADAWATALGNRVGSAGDIAAVLEYSRTARGISALCIVVGAEAGYQGAMRLRRVSAGA